jgi:hypothetical protein
MQAARTAGVKLMPRFVYTATANSGPLPRRFYLRPFTAMHQKILS